MQNHTQEFRYARALCILGLIILTVLGLSELGNDLQHESRRRLKTSSQKNIWDTAKDIPEIKGKKFDFKSKKNKKARGWAACAAISLGSIGASIATLNPFPALGVVGGLATKVSIAKFWAELETIQYEFKLGGVKGENSKDRVLVKMTKSNKKVEYAYLTDIIIEHTEPGTFLYSDDLSKNQKMDKANQRHRATFIMKSTGGFFSRVCNRTVYYMNGKYKDFKELKKMDKGQFKTEFGDLIAALGKLFYGDDKEGKAQIGFTLSKAGRKNFLKINCVSDGIEQGFQGMLSAVGLAHENPKTTTSRQKDLKNLLKIIKENEENWVSKMKTGRDKSFVQEIIARA